MNILLNILVVEDNDDLRDATMDALTTQGHHVTGVDCAVQNWSAVLSIAP